jgi:poly-beta-1,6-N-acetyl-D-glucosamine synthase
MEMAQILFWTGIGIALYTYVGYPILVDLASRMRRRACTSPPGDRDELPSLTVIVPACNEERWIARKIENTLAIDYPRERMEVVIASDGSSDRTVEIAQEFEGQGVTVAAFPTRVGKQTMLNRLVPAARGEVIVATDTHAMLQPDALKNLVVHFRDPEVAGATGRRVCVTQSKSAASVGEGLYWRYESWIKQSESRLHSCLGAHGQLYAIRQSVFPHVEKVGEDFFIPMKVIADTGRRIIFEPSALTSIPAAATLGIEFERKARAHVSFLLTLPMLKKLLLPWGSRVWWQFVSHHLMRMAVPPALLALMLSSAALAPEGGFYLAAALLQAAFYALAAIGGLLANRGRRPKLFYVPFYFTFVNAALGLAWLRWPRRKYDHAWRRTERLPDAN